MEDKIVFSKYHEMIENVGNRFQIALPFKEKEVNLPNNRSYTMKRMITLEQRFKRDQTLKNNYFKYMDDLLKEE